MFKNSIKGLDELFKGDSDIPTGSVILVAGIEGTLKSGLVFNMISNYLAGSSEHALYATLKEAEESHLRNMESLGIKKIDRLHVFDYKDIRLEWKNEELDIFKVTEDLIDFYKEKYDNLRVFALDSLNALYSLSSQLNLRKNMYCFFTTLREKDLTSFLIMETPSPERHLITHDYIEGPEYSLADGIIELGIFKVAGRVKRYIQIKKCEWLITAWKNTSSLWEKMACIYSLDSISRFFRLLLFEVQGFLPIATPLRNKRSAIVRSVLPWCIRIPLFWIRAYSRFYFAR